MKKFLLKLIVSLGVLAFILWQLGGLDEVGSLILGINLGFVALILLVNTLDRALMTYKWELLLAAKGERLPFLKGMRIYCASMVWGLFLPSTVGADAIRAFSTARAGFNINVIISSVVIERMVGFLVALILGLLGIVALVLTIDLDPRLVPVLWAIGIMIGSGCLIFSLTLNRSLFGAVHKYLLGKLPNNRVVARLQTLHETYISYGAEKRELGVFFVLTLFEQFLAILYAWLIAEALGINVHFLVVAGVMPLTLLLSRLPVSFDGIGIFEGIFALLMSLAGISAAGAVAIALTGRILNIFTWLPWWLAHIIEGGRIQKIHPVTEET